MEYSEIESFLKMIDKELMMKYKRSGIIKFLEKETGLGYKTIYLIMSGDHKAKGRKLYYGTKLTLEMFIKRYTDGDVDMSMLEESKRKKLRIC